MIKKMIKNKEPIVDGLYLLDKINIDKKSINDLKLKALYYKQQYKIHISICQCKSNYIFFCVRQKKGGSMYFPVSRLKKIVLNIFSDIIPKEYSHTIRVLPYIDDDICDLDLNYFENRREQYNTTYADIADDIGIREGNIEKIFTGNRPIPKWHKAAMYHYFNNKIEK